LQKAKPGYKFVNWYYGKSLNIPLDWEIELLDNVAKRGSGHTPNTKISEYYNGGIKWISLNDTKKLDEVYISDTAREISQEGLDNSSAIVYPKGTVVLSRDATIGKSAILTTNMAVSQSLMAWQCGDKLNNHYLYYFLQSQKQLLNAVANGTTLKTIGYPFFRKLKIILPSISEQEKISSILLNLDEILWKYDEYIAQTKCLKKGLMQTLLTKGIGHKKFKKVNWLFGKEIEIPDEWEIKKIGELFKLKSGSTPSRQTPEYFDGSIPWITSTDLNRTKITHTLEKITSNAVKQTNLKLLPKGTFLIATYGLEAAGTRGKCGITEMESTCNQACMAFLPSTEITPNFLFYFYLHFGEKIVFSIAQGTKQQNLYSDTIKKVSMLKPSITEQNLIVSILSSVDNKISKLESKKKFAELIKKGLMQKLLTGQIRVKV
jgi:type I restriction enzyme, S subunit